MLILCVFWEWWNKGLQKLYILQIGPGIKLQYFVGTDTDMSVAEKAGVKCQVRFVVLLNVIL